MASAVSHIGSSKPPAGWNWDHSYARLPELFFAKTLPVPVCEPRLAIFNRALAAALGLDADVLESPANTGIFAGNQVPDGAAPIAQAYAGHQFGHFTGLGDGRAILLGEHITPQGTRLDIQLKGSGRTPFSRGGDGRAALGPMLREYIISEAMHGLGIPTTRSLAVATTGEKVPRNTPLPGAVLTRVAASHIRVGTFQWAAAHQDPAATRALADHTRQRHFPDLANRESSHAEFLDAAIERQAALIAKWLHVGFIHGVMNTDNMALSGETIDYGPCAFMDHYDPDTVFSSIDRHGRYAYGNQPEIARWNLARLAEALLPLLHAEHQSAVDVANEALATFEPRFQYHWLSGMRAKLGMMGTAEKEDATLVADLLTWMQTHQMDFTNTFRALSSENAMAEPLFIEAGFIKWHENWSARLSRQPQTHATAAETMRSNNPAVIARNHKVEEALTAASENANLAPLEKLLEALAHPFEHALSPELNSPPPPNHPPYQTFCGT